MKTIQEIYDGNLDQSIRAFLAQVTFPEHPGPVRKPISSASTEWAEYAKELAAYEEQMLHYRHERGEAQRMLYGLEESLRLFLIELSGWQGNPKADNAWSYAWQEGHSSGYYEVYLILCNLYDYFA